MRAATIIAALERARASFGEDFKTFEGFKLVAGNVVSEEDSPEEYFEVVDSEEIFIKCMEWRKTLELKNRDFGNLSARYVTGHGSSD